MDRLLETAERRVMIEATRTQVKGSRLTHATKLDETSIQVSPD
jgi:hypothetical protein